ncbi:hypothetical protein P8452_45868 [Trifolium repens]|nr:hypothetical protein P8452_45868 [Trifolium repens]
MHSQNNYLAASLARDTFNNDGVHICSSKEVVDFVLLFILIRTRCVLLAGKILQGETDQALSLCQGKLCKVMLTT